ncbi:unnamed protein product [Paramecium octaurelia]|uniref:Uncharacterized protein n=1 Tax=Paramecium octaurelia TaxID=43137 RepID=A0A8S1XL58_PAROT|nr:unnamed protein product [Paramecium octaurelia]
MATLSLQYYMQQFYSQLRHLQHIQNCSMIFFHAQIPLYWCLANPFCQIIVKQIIGQYFIYWNPIWEAFYGLFVVGLIYNLDYCLKQQIYIIFIVIQSQISVTFQESFPNLEIVKF